MENQEKKAPLKRRIFVSLVLILVLAVLPALSWLYLKGGFEWRKDAMAELGAYAKIKPVYLIYPGNEKDNRVGGKVCVVHMFGQDPDLTAENQKILDTGQRLFEQFGQNMNFRLLMIASGGTNAFKSHAQTLPSAEYATWVWTGGLGSWSTIVNNGYEAYCYSEKKTPVPYFYGLTDTSGVIRRFYNAMDEKEVGRMVEHIALLLPKE